MKQAKFEGWRNHMPSTGSGQFTTVLNAVKSTRTGLQGSKVFAEKYALAEANAASYLRSLRTKL